MIDSIVSIFSGDLVGTVLGLIPPQLQGASIIVSAIMFLVFGRKQIFIRVVMRFFPNMFVKFMKNSGKSFNEFIEAKKEKGKLKDSWKMVEKKVIEGITAFNSELKK